MSQNDLLLMGIAALAVALIIRSQLNRALANANRQNTEQNIDKYSRFCTIIEGKLAHLRKLIDSDARAQNSSLDGCLEHLSDLERELVFIRTMSGQNAGVWEERLFELLSKIDSFAVQHLNGGEQIAQTIKDELKAEFNKLI